MESGEEYRFHHMTITDNESTRRLLEHAAEYTRPVMTGKIPIVLNDNPCRPISVKYNLKNGKSIYRSLLIDISNEQVVQWLRDTYNDTAYKEGAYPILTYKSGEGKNYVGMILDYAYGSEKLFLSEEEMQKFVETYQEELQKLSLDEILTQVPVLRMNLAVRMPKEDMQTVQLSTWKTSNVSYDYEEAYYKIYPSFTETLTLFKEYGAKLQNEIMPEEVACIEIHDSSREINDNDGLLSKVISLSYTTENGQSEEIAQILPHLVPSQFDLGLMAESRTEPYLSVHVFYGEEGKESGLFRILKGTIPEVVEKDLEEAAKEIDG